MLLLAGEHALTNREVCCLFMFFLSTLRFIFSTTVVPFFTHANFMYLHRFLLALKLVYQTQLVKKSVFQWIKKR